MNLEWSVPHTIVSRYGELQLNVPDPVTGRKYIVQSDGYKFVPALRVTQDNISQADGSVLHPRWKTGVVAFMTVALWVMDQPGDPTCPDGKPACETDLRVMEEELLLHLNAMRRLEANPQRLRWTPAAYGDDRMLDAVQLLSIWDPSYDLNGEEAHITFALESPFPYAIDATEIDTDIGEGSTGGDVLVTNAGNSPQSPVVRVLGPTNQFTLTNNSDLDANGDPKSVVYTMFRPGGQEIPSGHFAEIDFFRGTIILDGDGADLVASLDPSATDYWSLLAKTANDIEIDGADCTVLSNNSWA